MLVFNAPAHANPFIVDSSVFGIDLTAIQSMSMLSGPSLWLRWFTTKVGEPPEGTVQPEVAKMYIERDLMIAAAEEALNMKAEGKEDWCIYWLKWLWQQEIERAISNVKRGKP